MGSFLHALGFHPGAPLEQLKRIFNNVIRPTQYQATENVDLSNLALFYEAAVYEYLVKSVQDESEFQWAYNIMAPQLNAIGALNAPPASAVLPLPGAPPTVGFWLTGSGILSHTRQLLCYLHSMQQLAAFAMGAPIKPVVYIGAPVSGEAKKIFEQTGWPVHFLGDHSHVGLILKPLDLLGRLRDACARDSVDALVFVSTPLHMITAIAMDVAPVKIWWGMKYFGLPVPGLDGRIVSRRGDHVAIEGYAWACGHVAIPQLVHPDKAVMRDRLRHQYKIAADQVAIGFFGHEDKLTVEYGKAIAAVLEAQPHAVFLFTGHKRVPAFEEIFRNVATRVRFIGWVEISTCIWALDVFADAFPNGASSGAWAAIQAGIPVISCADVVLNDHVRQMVAGEGVDELQVDFVHNIFEKGDASYYPSAENPADYHYKLCQLAGDAAWRKDVGAAQLSFFNLYMKDYLAFAQNTSQAILKIIAQARGVTVDSLVFKKMATQFIDTSMFLPLEKTDATDQTQTQNPPSVDAAGASAGSGGAGPDDGSGAGLPREAKNG